MEKKRWAAFSLLGVVFALCCFWLTQGCTNQNPVFSNFVPTPQPVSVISSFGNASLSINPSLGGCSSPAASGGYFQSQTYGGLPGKPNEIDGSLTPNLLYAPPSGDPSADAYAIHIFGTQYDYIPPGGATNYPAFELFCYLSQTGTYLLDISCFTGIEMDMDIPSDDTDTQRLFGLGIAPQVPNSVDLGGDCPPNFSNNCYNYFWGNSYNNTWTATTGGIWKHYQFPFSTMQTSPYYGGVTYTSTGTAVNWGLSKYLNGNAAWEKEAVLLQWKFGDNGAGTTVYTDFWVDNVSFY